MSVTITAPESRVVPRGTTRLSWSSTYPQTAYEIQFRPAKGGAAWSTAGRVTSTSQSVDWDVSKLSDGTEYYFRVVVYSSNATSGTTIYNGSDISTAYSIIVTPKQRLAEMKVKYGSKMVIVPLWDDTTAEHSATVQLNDGSSGRLPLPAHNEPDAAVLKLEHLIGTRAAMKSIDASEIPSSNIDRETYIQKDDRNTLYSYYHATKYDRTYELGYYLAGYTYKYSTYDRGYYSYVSSTKYGTYNYYYYNRTYYRYTESSTCTGSYTRPASYMYWEYTNKTCYTTESHPGNCKSYVYYCYYGKSATGYYHSCNAGYCSSRAYYYTTSSYSCPTHYTAQKTFYYRESYTYNCGGGTRYDWRDDRLSGTKYYKYTGTEYARYYGYYKYQTPNYNPYYGYYRYYGYYKHTYYTYTRSYHYI